MDTANGTATEALLITLDEAAAIIGFSRRWMEKQISRGVLEPIHPAGARAVRLNREVFLQWVSNGCPDSTRR
jgi:excisionase family DNA binding protein